MGIKVVVAELLTSLQSAVRNLSKDVEPIPELRPPHFHPKSVLVQLTTAAKAICGRRNSFALVPFSPNVYKYHHNGRSNVPDGASELDKVYHAMRMYTVKPGTRNHRGSCSCYMYQDKLLCKHLLALRFELHLENAISSPKKKCGRPKKRRRAWETDDVQ